MIMSPHSQYHPSSTTFGLFFDSNNEVHVLDPEIGHVTNQLLNSVQEFIDKSEKFDQVLQQFVSVVGKVASDVEKARMKAIGSKDCNNWTAKRDGIIALIGEKRKELERIRVHRESLERSESDQNDLIASLNAQVKR